MNIELLELKGQIRVAEYLTQLPGQIVGKTTTPSYSNSKENGTRK